MTITVGEGVGEYNTINHVDNGEEASQVVFRRPSINLENRTDALKTCVDAEVLRLDGVEITANDNDGRLDTIEPIVSNHTSILVTIEPLALSALQPFPVVTAIADFTAVTDKIYVLVPTLSTMDVQLPAPVDTTVITFKDMSDDIPAKTITLVRNAAEDIDGLPEDFVFTVGKQAVTLVANGTNWFLINQGGSGGSGDASTILGRMEDLLDSSFFSFLEPNIFALDQVDKVGSSTGVFSAGDKGYLFQAAENLVSYELLDLDFLEDIDDLLSAMVVVVFESGNEDSAPVVELTNNGVDYQPVTMDRLSSSSDTFVGNINFDLSTLTPQVIDEYSVSNESSSLELNVTTQQQISQEFTTDANNNVVNDIELYVSKLGAPLGFLKVNIHEDNAGDAGIVRHQSLVSVTGLSVGNNTLALEIGRQLLQPSTKYHLSIETDAAYATSFITATDVVSIRLDNSTPAINDLKKFNGTVWSATAGSALVYKTEGRVLSLLLKYTASEAATLVGYGVYYGSEAENIQRLKRRNAFVFNGTIDNLNEFQLTFDADPDFLVVTDVYTGQSWQVPSFELQNNKVVFETGFFDGRDDVHLIAKQVEAGSFDANPELLKLVTENHMASADPALNKGVAGRGQSVLTAVTALRVEITVDENFQIVIKEA